MMKCLQTISTINNMGRGTLAPASQLMLLDSEGSVGCLLKIDRKAGRITDRYPPNCRSGDKVLQFSILPVDYDPDISGIRQEALCYKCAVVVCEQADICFGVYRYFPGFKNISYPV